MSDQQQQQYTQLHVSVQPDGNIRLGNCLHCVTTRERPPISKRALYHPAGAIDLDQDELLAENARFVEALAKLGIQVSEICFVPKDSMPRAIE